jgi:hypothetical protein
VQRDTVGLLTDVADHPDFEVGGSFTLQAWIETAPATPAGQELIVFRGDERSGTDPFALSLQAGGIAHFVVAGQQDDTGCSLSGAAVRLGEPVLLTAEFDAERGRLRLFVDCAAAEASCTGMEHALCALDARQSPGLGLGSHARRGGGSYTFSGILDEVRVYDGLLEPAELLASFPSRCSAAARP